MNVNFLSNNKWFLYIISLLSCYLILFIKAWYITETGDLLWIEDGTIFLTQANKVGILSLLIPYAGYSCLLMRLGAWISSFFDYSYQPLILLIFIIILYAFYLLVIYITLQSQEIRSEILSYSLFSSSYA